MSKDNNINDTEAATAVPEGQKDSLSSFVATLASFSGDLSSLTCPSFLLSSVSLLEYRCVSFSLVLSLSFSSLSSLSLSPSPQSTGINITITTCSLLHTIDGDKDHYRLTAIFGILCQPLLRTAGEREREIDREKMKELDEHGYSLLILLFIPKYV
jgi:hypothetical protein